MPAIGKILMMAALAAASLPGLASAQVPPQPETPKSWNYTVGRNGQRIPKVNRVTNPDGSWREEVRQGNCVTVKERSADGEYKETRQCNPQNPN
jgi:hypothetical protein